MDIVDNPFTPLIFLGRGDGEIRLTLNTSLPLFDRFFERPDTCASRCRFVLLPKFMSGCWLNKKGLRIE